MAAADAVDADAAAAARQGHGPVQGHGPGQYGDDGAAEFVAEATRRMSVVEHEHWEGASRWLATLVFDDHELFGELVEWARERGLFVVVQSDAQVAEAVTRWLPLEFCGEPECREPNVVEAVLFRR
jgi:hypothetical protein